MGGSCATPPRAVRFHQKIGFRWVGQMLAGFRYLWKNPFGHPLAFPSARHCDADSLVHKIVGNLSELLFPYEIRMFHCENRSSLAGSVDRSAKTHSAQRAPEPHRRQSPTDRKHPSRRTTPSVSVPVLSVHSTSMPPRSSMAVRRRTNTPCSAIASALRERLMLKIAGNNSGLEPATAIAARISHGGSAVTRAVLPADSLQPGLKFARTSAFNEGIFSPFSNSTSVASIRSG